MNIFYIIIFFIFGVIMGSFYNVVGIRLSNNESIVKPRSHCPNCNHVLAFWELIPIVSYIILKGKCSNCHKKISIFYPIIELITGILFSISYYSFGFSYDLIIVLLIISLFSIVIVSDLNYYIIPDQVTLTVSILIFIVNILKYGFIGALSYLLNGIIMFIFMYLVMLFGNYIFKQESLGGGDIKLLFALGMCLPVISSFVGLIIATILALPLSLYLMLRKKDKVLPFGPFLVSGTLIMLMLKINVDQIYTFLNFLM